MKEVSPRTFEKLYKAAEEDIIQAGICKVQERPSWERTFQGLLKEKTLQVKICSILCIALPYYLQFS